MVDGKLRKVVGWDLGGLRKKKCSLAGDVRAPVAGFGRETVREMRVRGPEGE